MSKDLTKYLLSICGIILGWSLLVPAFEFPDEQAHLGSVSYLSSTGHMPNYDKPDLTYEMAETQKLLGIFRDGYGNNEYTYHPDHHVEYASGLTGLYESDILSLNTEANRSTYVGSEAAKYPPLYYHFVSVFMNTVDGSDLFTRLYLSRLAGLVLAYFMGYFVYQIGQIMFSKKIYAKTLVFLVILQPMMSFVTAGVNSDNLHNLLFIIILYFGLRLIDHSLKIRDLLCLGLVIGLDIYTKPQGFIAILIGGLAILIAVIKSKKWQMLGWGVFIGFIAVALGFSQWETYKGLLSVNNNFGTTFIDYLRFTANKLMAQNVVWYWGVFKWLGVVLPPTYWRVANRVVLLSVVGIIIYWWKTISGFAQKGPERSRRIVAEPYSIFYLLTSSILYALVIFWYDWQHTKANGYSLGIQARYFFPTIVAHMSIFMTGILSLGWNSKSRVYLRRALILLFAWLQLGGIWRIISIYYPAHSGSEYISMFSQYKPFFAKGEWWYLWVFVYFVSIIYLISKSWKQNK